MSSEDGVSFKTKLFYTYCVMRAMTILALGRLYPSLRPYLPQDPKHLANKHAIVTGANSGIGLQIAKDLAHLGATVTLACRSMTRGEDAVKEILKLDPTASDRIHLRHLDTSLLSSVREFADSFSNTKVDILVNNAGIASPPPNAPSPFSSEGYDLVYATNFLGSFLLTHLLEPRLADNARVIFTSSTGQYSGVFTDNFSPSGAKNSVENGFHMLENKEVGKVAYKYGMTKSMQCAFARSLQAKWDHDAKVNGKENRRVAHSFTPGFTATPIFAKFEIGGFLSDPVFWLLQASTLPATPVSEGAATGTWLASTNDVKVTGAGGGYWERNCRILSNADVFKRDLLDRLWARWEADAGIEWR